MPDPALYNLPDNPAELAWFLDVDGTLLPIAETPAAVSPSGALCALLAKLSVTAGGALALISGRPLAELDHLFSPHRFPAAGQHGGERRDAAGRLMHAAIDHGALGKLRAYLQRLAHDDPRLLLEDKGLSLALHYRRAPQRGPALAAALRQTLVKHPQWVLLSGKQVLELRPTAINKASAVRAFLSETPFAGRVPLFIGDDATDEDGFAGVNALHGVSVKVGEESTRAHWRLKDSAAVLKWLASCADGQFEHLEAT